VEMPSENRTDYDYLREGICKIKRPELYCEIVAVVMFFHVMLQFHFAHVENCYKKYKGRTRQQVTFTHAIGVHNKSTTRLLSTLTCGEFNCAGLLVMLSIYIF